MVKDVAGHLPGWGEGLFGGGAVATPVLDDMHRVMSAVPLVGGGLRVIENADTWLGVDLTIAEVDRLADELKTLARAGE